MNDRSVNGITMIVGQIQEGQRHRLRGVSAASSARRIMICLSRTWRVSSLIAANLENPLQLTQARLPPRIAGRKGKLLSLVGHA
jgi:hypothetical protein